MHKLAIAVAAPVALAVLFLAGCESKPPQAPAIAEAWAGPATLKLRREIPLDSPVVATVRHGERLEIIQQRRRFMKVRTPGGAEGWTEDNVLLSAPEMDALRQLADSARKLSSHGVATTFDLLNVHTTPARLSPSFTQVKQGDKMQVLAHVVAPRVAPPRQPLVPRAPKRVRPPRKPKQSKYPLLPLPAPPPPPANWLELSKTSLPAPPEPVDPPKPIPMDDWTLVRLPSGQAGWVLTRRLFMAIPDEVAQYAEGHRITSYFPLGEVDDGGQKKYNWLWTTLSAGLVDYDFDSFRVFIWSLRRHRYETAYIERRITGWFPVAVHPVTLTSSGRSPISTTYPGFSICTAGEDGQRRRRDFAFIVNVVRYAGQGPCAAEPVPGIPAQPASGGTLVASSQPARPAAEPPSFLARVQARLAELRERWLGKRRP